MYGLINNAMRSMIREKFGDEQWDRIQEASGVPEDSFLTMRSYDDAVTYDLVGAAAEVLGARLRNSWNHFTLGSTNISWQRFTVRLAAHGPVRYLKPV